MNDTIPDPASFTDPVERASAEKALAYMGLKPGVPLTDVTIDKSLWPILHQLAYRRFTRW